MAQILASSRRSMLRGSAAVLLAGATAAVASAAPAPDAELLAACAEFDALEAAYLATGFHHVSGSPEEAAADAEQSRITAAQTPLVNRMVEHRAVTPAGQVARARSLLASKPDLAHGEFAGDAGEFLVFAILRDLVGEA